MEIKKFDSNVKMGSAQNEVKADLFQVVMDAVRAAGIPEELITQTKDCEVAIGAGTFGDVELPFTITVGAKTPIKKTQKNGTVIEAYDRLQEGANYQKALAKRAEKSAEKETK